ncbi:MAG TPA: penicillin-binding protein 2, partial [bacterium]|nr:penicillin-binding protein 2 [bacterium]
RGLILDRDDRVLADSRPSYTVLAVPRDILRRDASLDLLAELLEAPREVIEERLRSGPSHLPRVVRHDVSFAQVSRVAEREEELPGVSLEVKHVRSYPRGIMAAHLLGQVGEVSEHEVTDRAAEAYRLGDFVGRLGLERVYERDLRGKDGERYLEVDVVGRVVGAFRGREPRAPTPGSTLRLYLDVGLQAAAESCLVGRRGAVCLLDVRTGGVRVLASAPAFDPNLFATGINSEDWSRLNTDPDKPLLNRTVQALYAPGSTFKMVSFALTLEERIAGLRQRLGSPCVGGYQFGNRWFRCWEEEGHGFLDLQGALVHSCDVYFYQIAEASDVDELAGFSRGAGLGAPTGVDLPQELRGNVPTAAWLDERYGKRGWTRGAMLNLIIGQGEYLVTPLQMAAYAAGLANGGPRPAPRIVRSIEAPDGTVRTVPTRQAGEWELPSRTMERIRAAMELVVTDEEGTGRSCRVEGYMPAAKTGTSENSHGRPHAWFVGYAPAHDPEVAFAVLVEAGGHGSESAAPIAKVLLKGLAPPDTAAVTGDAS